jgi:kynurenine formamidase
MLLNQYKFIDLTHTLSPNIPTWTGSCGFHLEIKRDYDQMFRVQQIKMHASAGTHIDAPSHLIPEGKSIADIPIEHLISPACIVDVSKKADSDYEVLPEDLTLYEREFGKIEARSFVILATGWHRFFSNPEKYRNLDKEGKMHFPALSKDAAKILCGRDVSGIGIDTLSPDCSDMDYRVHRLLLGAGKYIIENIADTSAMPPKGGFVIALPLKGSASTEAPVRIIGLIPKHSLG